MRITRVQIENWRSIKNIDFQPQDICILVGANNAGKTSILSAINFLLGDRYPMPGNLEDSDFYNRDRQNNIFIRITVEHPHFSAIDFDTSRTQYVLNAYDRNGQYVRGFSNVHREQLAFAYVDASRNYDRQFSVSRWSMFGQALRHLHRELRESGDNLQTLKETLAEAHRLLQTDLYRTFEAHLQEAFTAQLRTAGYDVAFEFRTVEETNLYKGLYPTLVERGQPRHPNEVGSGVRNVLVLALFQAFAQSFRGSAVLGIEEPELYLHPHAQRSLMRQFEELASAGNQIFVSSHSAHFLDVARSDRIVLVERCGDVDADVCTQIQTATVGELLAARRELHPTRDMSAASLREFIQNIRTSEMTEAFFARVIVIVEGATEREVLPIYARHTGFDFDSFGVSVVAANSKSAIDTLAQVYGAHSLRYFIIFDNDAGNNQERETNRVLCRLLGIVEADNPQSQFQAGFAILDGNWERHCKAELDCFEDGLHDRLEQEARSALGISGGRNKPLVARFVAKELVRREIVPPFVVRMLDSIRAKLPDGAGTA